MCHARRSRLLLLLSLLLLPLLGAPVAQAQSTDIPPQMTASYMVALSIEPPMEMMLPDQAATAGSGEVVMPMPDMPMPDMSMMMLDQGMMANHHLEVHIYDAVTGAVVTGLMPMIRVMDQATGAIRTLDNVMAMYDVQLGMSDLHFGQNVYLPDGMYTLMVDTGAELATFPDVMISGGSDAMPAMPMPTP